MPEQLTLFDVETPQKVYRCDACFCRWVNPLIECPLCHPDTSHATCEACQQHFEDSLYAIEHMALGGRILCDICLPRVSADDCRDDYVYRNDYHEDYEAKIMALPGTRRWKTRREGFVPVPKGDVE